MRNLTVAGTGPRAAQLWDNQKKQRLLNEIQDTLSQLDPVHVITGGAEGFDAALAKAAHNLSIPYTLALPTEGYLEYYWGQASQTGRNRLDAAKRMVDRANEVVIVSPTRYNKEGIHANFLRNLWMMERADLMIVLHSTTPGTQHAIRHIKENNIPHQMIRIA